MTAPGTSPAQLPVGPDRPGCQTRMERNQMGVGLAACRTLGASAGAGRREGQGIPSHHRTQHSGIDGTESAG